MQSPAKERVLVVDDEPQVLVALEDLLTDKFAVVKTGSAENALDLMSRERDIAVVITDQRMPGMTGDQLLSKLGDTSGAKRILLTGFADLSAVIRAINDGQIFAYVTKPWNPMDLEEKVRHAAEQYRLGRQLDNERRLLHELLNNIPDGIYFKDASLRFVRVNPACSSLLGFDHAEALVGKRLGELDASGTDVFSVESEERGILMSGLPVRDVVRVYRRGRRERWFSETKAPIRNVIGEVVGIVGITREITEQRKLEHQLRHAQKMEAIGRLAGSVAHDFNNLLSVILSYSSLIMADLGPNDPMRPDVEAINKAGTRAADLTRQLLAFSRKQLLAPRTLDLNGVLRESESMLGRLLGEDVELVVELAGGLHRVRADPGQIDQIVMNLAVNARDAMPNGGTFRISTENVELDGSFASDDPDRVGVGPGPYVMVTFADTGVGMDRETQANIFEPFFTTKEKGKGTGLGLATVFGIVKQSGGHIVVESEPGHGSVFRLYLPQADGVEDVPQEKQAPTELSGSETVLLTEDQDDVRAAAREVLRRYGYQVLEARNAGEALLTCERYPQPIDLLLTDVVMPQMSGRELADRLSGLRPEMKVLYMSGYTDSAIVNDGELEANIAYLPKPWLPEALARRVREVLDDKKPS
ncbi:MAG: response regulator [Myxococcota bacterium]|nr:response regulator [Myxococcota bacterium]